MLWPAYAQYKGDRSDERGRSDETFDGHASGCLGFLPFPPLSFSGLISWVHGKRLFAAYGK